MATFWERTGARLASRKLIRKEKRGEFLKLVGGLEKAGIDPLTILLWMEVILMLLEAAKPLAAKLRELLDALRKKERPDQFLKRWGVRK